MKTIFQEITQMKKLLITTTAIIGASMIASAAHAESNVSASGSYTSIINLGGDDTVNDSMTFGGSTFDLAVNASKTTDAGLKLSAATSLDITGVDDPTTGNETSAAIAAGFGTVSFSNDGGSAAGVTTAEGLSPSWNGFSDQINGSVPSNAGIGASGNSITYTSPNINGLTFGYTMAENGGNSEYDASKEGTLVDSDNNDAFTAPEDRHTSYTGFGIKYSMAGAFVNFGSSSQETSVTVKGEENEDLNGKYGSSWSGSALSLGYATGPFAVRYSSVTKEHDPVTIAGTKADKEENIGTIADTDTNEVQIGFSFNYGAGKISYVQAQKMLMMLKVPLIKVQQQMQPTLFLRLVII